MFWFLVQKHAGGMGHAPNKASDHSHKCQTELTRTGSTCNSPPPRSLKALRATSHMSHFISHKYQRSQRFKTAKNNLSNARDQASSSFLQMRNHKPHHPEQPEEMTSRGGGGGTLCRNRCTGTSGTPHSTVTCAESTLQRSDVINSVLDGGWERKPPPHRSPTGPKEISSEVTP